MRKSAYEKPLREDAHCARKEDVADATALGSKTSFAGVLQAKLHLYGFINIPEKPLREDV